MTTDTFVPSLVRAQADLRSNAIALRAGDEALTYADLDVQSNRVAHYLRSLGVGPGVVVGVCLPRSISMIVGALGILKAGGAYLPLDPAYPAERIGRMLHDAQPLAVLTTCCVAKKVPDGTWRKIALDGEWSHIASYSGDTIASRIAPTDLAYVIYTSGSTGQPKGVEIAHDSLLNLVVWHQQTFEITAADRASQLSSPGFDAAVWEIWPYLTGGASVHLPLDSIRSDPESVRDWMVSERITIGFVPTPLAERMISLKWPRQTTLRLLLTGADTLHSFPPAGLPFTLVNNYGPTECTVVATSGTIPTQQHRDLLPSIGRPISNVQIYILDEQLKQVPVGASGEIYIGGAGVARGYVNDPSLTAAKFVPNPFDSQPNRRLYRTGDLGRYVNAGQVAFLGRIDEQIKIRGHRIEPNEIVAALAGHPAVQASFVTTRESGTSNKQLLAYIVLKPGILATDADLRDFLSAQLPEYMVPALFVQIDSLPVNANGKIDRGALPAPDDANSFHVHPYVAPRTPVEQRIAEILGPLLGIEKVGVEDNFFLLGGHSLLGTQLIARTREAFGVALSLRSVFEAPSIAALAAEVERLLYIRLEATSEEEAEQLVKGAESRRAAGC